jgi:hypothetical protein
VTPMCGATPLYIPKKRKESGDGDANKEVEKIGELDG